MQNRGCSPGLPLAGGSRRRRWPASRPAGFERVLGPRHPDTLWSRAGLAQVYRRLGRYGDARALLRDTVGRLGRILPDGDPLIIELRQSLAGIGEE
jgi:hypothetical protein